LEILRSEIAEALRALDDAVTRSKPMPVSTWRAGKGEEGAIGFRVELDEDQFQISMQRASPLFTSEPRVFPSGVRST